MPDRFTVSRRNATMFIAGTLAASAGSATAATARGLDVAPQTQSGAGRHREERHRTIAGLLRRVRRTHGAARVEAFERCKTALRDHDLAEAFVHDGAPAASATLYRYADPAAVLGRIIVRELDALPMTDPAWLERFGDLEITFDIHVNG